MMLGHAALGTRLMRGLTAGVLGMVLLWGWMTGYRLCAANSGSSFGCRSPQGPGRGRRVPRPGTPEIPRAPEQAAAAV